MKRALALALLAATGCSNNLDSLYSTPAKTMDSGARAPVPEPIPWLPALPDPERQADCEQCAMRTCATARASCLEDSDCTAELRCRGQCSDPACMQTCNAVHGFSPWYVDYASCVFGQCPSECSTGSNWTCWKRYDWPVADATTFKVRFNFRTPPSFLLGLGTGSGTTGDMVSACDDSVDCLLEDQAELALDGTVELAVRTGPVLLHFRGYLELERTRARVYNMPLARAQEYFCGFFPFFSPGTLIAAYVTDCLGHAAPGVRVSLPDRPEPAMYVSGLAVMPGEKTTAIGIGVILGLPDSALGSPLRVRATRTDNGDTISERAVWVRSGFGTHLRLVPAARSD